ncbi:MAG: type I restriction-modification system subunit M N-terminal domain-containing protein [Rhodanobacteraceae bacterium]
MNQQSLSAFIWSVADLLRGDYKQSEYGRVILPFTVLRRLDCVLAPTKAAVLKEHAERKKTGVNPEPFLLRKAGTSFYNTSPLDMKTLAGDQDNIRANLHSYVQAFSPDARDIFERFDFHTQVDRLAKAKLLYLVTEKFAQVDLHPDAVDNRQMGLVFEELIRKFAELSNETAGEAQVKAVSEVREKVNPYLSYSGQPPFMQPTGVGLLQQSVRPKRLLASSHWVIDAPRNSMVISPLAAQHHMLVSWGEAAHRVPRWVRVCSSRRRQRQARRRRST